MKTSSIIVEKFENEDSGIYMILNLETKNIYIGKSLNLKRRMEEHVRNLYSGYDNNKDLQVDFNKSIYTYRIALLKIVSPEELNKYESIFYQAAAKQLGKNKLYNKQDLKTKYSPTHEELDEAIEIICKAISRKVNKRNAYTFNSFLDARRRLQDWLGKSEDEILKIADKRIDYLTKKNGESRNLQKPVLESISIKELYENNNFDYTRSRVMGDYFGDEREKSFADILGEKIGDIAYYGGKCLWAAAGPSLLTFKELKDLNCQKGKKIYALFSLTLHEYNKTKDNNVKTYKWTDANGNVYFDTAPERSTKSFKGLVITRFWTVKEDFPIDDFYDLYYRLERKQRSTGQRILANDVSQCTRSMQAVVSKKEILNDKDLQETLALDDKLIDQFKKEKLSKTEEEYSSFLPCTDEPHPVLYILAEVSDYVLMDEVIDN